MIYRARPVTTRLRKRFRGDASLKPSSITIIDEGATWNLPPPIFLDDELGRIAGHAENLIPEQNLDILTTRIFKQGSTEVWRWDDAVVADGCIMTPDEIDVIASRRRRPFLFGRPEQLGEIALCSTYQTERFFGHWMTDGLASELFAAEGDLVSRTFQQNHWGHRQGYRDAAGIEVAPIDFARVEKLWTFKDHELTTERIRRIKIVRNRLRAQHQQANSRKVFLRRGSTGIGRTLVNEAEIAEQLSRSGYNIVNPEEESPSSIIRQLRDAETVVAVEGSTISHAIMTMPEGGGLMVIQPPHDFNACFRPIAELVGVRFGFTVADAAGVDLFRMDIPRLQRALDKLEVARATG